MDRVEALLHNKNHRAHSRVILDDDPYDISTIRDPDKPYERYETMVTDPDGNYIRHLERAYSTIDQAITGHNNMVCCVFNRTVSLEGEYAVD